MRPRPIARGTKVSVDFGRWRDLLLFVGTPAVLIPLFAAAQARWSAQDIFLFVGAFGAMGHHLPGMIRAYGDKALFHRFRTRFVVAPLVLSGRLHLVLVLQCAGRPVGGDDVGYLARDDADLWILSHL